MKDIKLYNTKEIAEKVILIGIEFEESKFSVEDSLDELEELVKTAGAIVVGKMTQKRESIHRAHYFGKGKIEELELFIHEKEATGIVCDDELTSNQIRNMEKMLNTKVMNRTMIILDIFASRASSFEGKLQVELAQLKYNRSHLIGKGIEMSRLGGGIGTRGPGEKKLETDRRNISNRISELNHELLDIEKHRKVLREKRITNNVPVVALAGYTNAGKSTLMNTLTNAGVLAEDKLFATLDTTTRKIFMPSGAECLFTDTVGFIQKLPLNLIQAFKATLEELKYADIIIHIVDASNSSREEQMDTVYKTFQDLNCDDKPIITVFNKIDKDIEKPLPFDKHSRNMLSISAKQNKGIEAMLESIEKIIKETKKTLCLLIPYDKGNLLSIIHGNCEIIKQEHKNDGVYIELYADNEIENRLKDYIINENDIIIS